MTKILLLVLIVFAVIGLYKSLAVTLISLLVIPVVVYAHFHFKRMDELEARRNCPASTEETLKYQTCNWM